MRALFTCSSSTCRSQNWWVHNPPNSLTPNCPRCGEKLSLLMIGEGDHKARGTTDNVDDTATLFLTVDDDERQTLPMIPEKAGESPQSLPTNAGRTPLPSGATLTYLPGSAARAANADVPALI